LIADEDKMEDETDEGDREGVVGDVAGREVVEMEEDVVVVVVEMEEGDVVVEGSADTEVGVAMVEKDMIDPELVGGIVGRSDDDGAGEDKPP
jgi:formylmethanofuran dehydrogenase subunit C